MTLYSGSCHCGAVTFEIDDADVDELTMCDCSLCRRRNALMAQVHNSRLRVLSGEDKITLYQWNTRVARHFFCSVCGIYTFHRKRSAPDYYGVNVMCLDGFDIDRVPVRRAEGQGMSVRDPDARSAWPGPRD